MINHRRIYDQAKYQKICPSLYNIAMLDYAGQVWMLGANGYGQLGDQAELLATGGTAIARAVAGNHSFVDVSIFNSHAVALKSNGTAWCWGYGAFGAVGDNAGFSRSSPVSVAGNHSFISVAAGDGYTMGLKANGQLWGWGYNPYGQYGVSTSTAYYFSPVQAVGNHSFVSIATKGYASFALKSDGTLWAMGYNGYGQLGDNSTTSQQSPVRVAGNHSFIKVIPSTSYATAIKADGTAWSWGFNTSGQLGDGTSVHKSSPVAVYGGHSFIDIAATCPNHCIALKADGSVWGWGSGTNGQLGINNSTYYNPVQVYNNIKIKSIYTGLTKTFLVDDSDNIYVLGLNNRGDRGDFNTENIYTPMLINIKRKKLITNHSVNIYNNDFDNEIDADNQILLKNIVQERISIGPNTYYQSGVNKSTDIRPQIADVGLNNNKKIITGTSFSVILKENGKAYVIGALERAGNGTRPTYGIKHVVQMAGDHQFVQLAENGQIMLKADGTAWAWGVNTYGELGDNSTTTRSSPVSVVGNHSFVRVYGGGIYASYALKADGTAWTWGSQGSQGGVLGDLSATTKSSPVSVVGNHSFIKMGKNLYSSMSALKADGTAWCWGYNSSGNLGDNTRTNRSSPVSVVGNHSFIDISTADNFTIALKADGSVWGWGDGSNGQLGESFTYARSSPVLAVGSHSFVSITTGALNGLGRKADGSVWSWGDGPSGGLGDNTLISKSSPVSVAGNHSFIDIMSCYTLHLGIKQNGEFWAWGQWTNCVIPNATAGTYSSPVLVNMSIPTTDKSRISLMIGNGNIFSWLNENNKVCLTGNSSAVYGYLATNAPIAYTSVPVEVAGNHSFIDISIGGNGSVLALKANGECWGWGLNTAGQLGDGSLTTRSSPVSVTGYNSFTSIYTAASYSMAVKSDRSVWSWGSNAAGALGIGTGLGAGYGMPQAVAGNHSFTMVCANPTYATGIKADGTIWNWGDPSMPMGTGGLLTTYYPIKILNGLYFDTISVGNDFCMGLVSSNGTAWGWGYNLQGELGNNSVSPQSSPVSVVGNHSFVKLICNGVFGYSAALKSDGTCWAWGRNATYLFLGDGTTIPKSSPVSVIGNHSFIDISPGRTNVLALKADGTAWAWGNAGAGSLGDLTATTKSSPVSVVGNHSFVQILAASSFSCAVKADGSVWTWGVGGSGQLGDGSNTSKSSPVSVVGNHSFVSVYKGAATLYGLKSDGSAWGWGYNGYGALGDGSNVYKSSPVRVIGNHSFIKLAGSYYFTLGLKSDGTLWGWGNNDWAQLGNIDLVSRSSPILINTIGSVQDVIAHDLSPRYIIKSNNERYIYGHHYYMIGDPTLSDRSFLLQPIQALSIPNRTPVKVVGSKNSASYNVAFLANDGTIWSVGALSGDNTLAVRYAPSQIANTSSFVDVVAGQGCYYAIKADGSVYSWGLNAYGQLGTGDFFDRSSPVLIRSIRW